MSCITNCNKSITLVGYRWINARRIFEWWFITCITRKNWIHTHMNMQYRHMRNLFAYFVKTIACCVEAPSHSPLIAGYESFLLWLTNTLNHFEVISVGRKYYWLWYQEEKEKKTKTEKKNKKRNQNGCEVRDDSWKRPLSNANEILTTTIQP